MTPYYKDEFVTIYCGDNSAALGLVPDASVDAIWTDPPYGNNNADGDFLSQRSKIMKDGGATKQVPIANDGRVEMQGVVENILTHATRVLKRAESTLSCCCSGGGPAGESDEDPAFAWLATRMNRSGLAFFHSVIWDKKNPGVGWRFRRQHEMIMVAHRSGGAIRWREDGQSLRNVLSYDAPRNRYHPNEKPEGLVREMLAYTSRPGDMVLDPCMGSGTTLVVAKQLGRRSIGMELDEAHCATAVSRLGQGVIWFDMSGTSQPPPPQLALEQLGSTLEFPLPPPLAATSDVAAATIDITPPILELLEDVTEAAQPPTPIEQPSPRAQLVLF